MTGNDYLAIDAAGTTRCWWCGDDPEYVRYHDEEWGRPTTEDRRLFEKICLEGFQSGLSWLTILRKRPNFRAAFADFDIEVVAGFGDDDVARLLDDAGIVRHRGKIEATINNAQRCIELVDEKGSLCNYAWEWEPKAREPDITKGGFDGPVANMTATSTALSKDLKKRGWRFFGPTTAYAFMQAMGLVNDHVDGCEWRETCLDERAKLQR